jgi:alpha-beta hydrolase superfamily lysophospholipase
MVTGIGEQLIQSEDGTGIFVKQYHCENPKAQILVSHGYLEHCLRYSDFAEFLNSKGISVTLYDLRGHGSSEGYRAGLGEFREYHADLESVMSTLLPPSQLSTFLLGHSTGGLILLDYMLQNPDALAEMKGCIIVSPYVAPSEKLNPLKVGVAKLFGKLVPNLPIPADLPVEDLTSDPKKQNERNEDRKCLSNARAGWASEVLTAQARVQTLVENTDIPVPVLLVYSDSDPVACPAMSQKIGEKLKVTDKTVIKRKEEKHEVLNEVNRQELFDAMNNWINETLKDFKI